MGARHAELALGVWMLLTPFVFGHVDVTALLVHDLAVALVLLVVPLLCYVRRWRRAHLLLLPLAGWLVGRGWWVAANAAEHVPASSQNHVVVGLILAMLAVVPSRATDRPEGWRGVEAEQARLRRGPSRT